MSFNSLIIVVIIFVWFKVFDKVIVFNFVNQAISKLYGHSK